MVDVAKRQCETPETPETKVEDDTELQQELQTLIEQIINADEILLPQALPVLNNIIKCATTSMTSVPKPLKYLAPYYGPLKLTHTRMKENMLKKQVSDIISVMAMCSMDPDAERELECLKYCMLGTRLDIGGWGHEYIHHLESQIVEQLLRCQISEDLLTDLIHDCLKFDCQHHGEIQACDFLMEIDKLDWLPKYLNASIYQRVCLYLTACTRYVDELEHEKIYKVVSDQYLLHQEWIRALIIAMYTKNNDMVNIIFNGCQDKLMLKQLAFIAGRQLQNVRFLDMSDRDDIIMILNNSCLSQLFLTLGRELDIMEPKTPEDVYKTWLESGSVLPSIINDHIDSAKQNLASTFVNGFVNAGFGCDNMVTGEAGNRWIYRNKDNGMLSATACLGLIHLWDVDGGLTPIDKYLYSSDEMIKAGALFALGIVNCRVRNECDPALALLADFVNDKSAAIKNAAVLGLGLSYLATVRDDVSALLISVIDTATNAEAFATACMAAGMVCVGSCHAEVNNAILLKLVDWRENDIIKSPHMPMAVLGLGFLFLGRKDIIDTTCEALEVFTEPYNMIYKSILHMCAYAGTGDVFSIQKMLGNIGDLVNLARDDEKDDKDKKEKEKERNKNEFDPSLAQAIPVLGLGCVSMGEETGVEMCARLLGSVGRYGDPAVRRAVPLAIAINSVSKPQMSVIEVLTKYSHDNDDRVACNAIFGLGVVGAGTNNARLAAGLRQLAVYHSRNAPELFMVRLAQGLTHMGKGTMTLNPLHTDKQLIDYAAVAGLLIPLVALLDTHALILGKSHFLLYTMAAAMQPRWVITLNEDLHNLSAAIRVGQAIDTVGKAGAPKTIAGIHTHTTPVLLAAGERAELAIDQYESVTPILEGICVLKKKTDFVMDTTP